MFARKRVVEALHLLDVGRAPECCVEQIRQIVPLGGVGLCWMIQQRQQRLTAKLDEQLSLACVDGFQGCRKVGTVARLLGHAAQCWP
ncbi:hypothetical protein HC891_26580 [Candidatus Gracilibacteria bacterium]|nr:hypothetical protein [Candidatus Gracilibacteria bacterium]